MIWYLLICNLKKSSSILLSSQSLFLFPNHPTDNVAYLKELIFSHDPSLFFWNNLYLTDKHNVCFADTWVLSTVSPEIKCAWVGEIAFLKNECIIAFWETSSIKWYCADFISGEKNNFNMIWYDFYMVEGNRLFLIEQKRFKYII